MRKEELISNTERPLLRVLGIIQVVFILIIISAPFVWIWGTGELAGKLFLTGLIGALIIRGLYALVQMVVRTSIEEAISKYEPNKKTKGKFAMRLEEMINSREN